MTEPTPEPTLADVLAVVNAGFAQLTTALATTNANLEAQNRAVAALSSKTAFIEANQNVLMDRQAELRGAIRTSFEAVARDMKQVQEGIAGVKADTAFVERWNQDMHEALVRHIADPHAHPDAA